MGNCPVEKYLECCSEINDRFSFDLLLRKLLEEGYEHEMAKDIIIHNCSLSLLVWQERIHNEFYLEITENDGMAEDLMELANELTKEHLAMVNWKRYWEWK